MTNHVEDLENKKIYNTQGTELVNEDSEQKGLNKNGLIRPKKKKKIGGNPAGV